ncbi:MAG: hypothetical protein ACM3S1_01190, partial [Hyphomicrobiales bacterium]
MAVAALTVGFVLTWSTARRVEAAGEGEFNLEFDSALGASLCPPGEPGYCVLEGQPLKIALKRTGGTASEVKVQVEISGGAIGFDYAETNLSKKVPEPDPSENPPMFPAPIPLRPAVIELTYAAGSEWPTATDTKVLPGDTGLENGLFAFQTLSCDSFQVRTKESCAWTPTRDTIPPQAYAPGFKVTIRSVSAGTIGPRSSTTVTFNPSAGPLIQKSPTAPDWDTAIDPQSGGAGDFVMISGKNFGVPGSRCNAPGYPYTPGFYTPPTFLPVRCVLRVGWYVQGSGFPFAAGQSPSFEVLDDGHIRAQVPGGLVDGQAYDVRITMVDP